MPGPYTHITLVRLLTSHRELSGMNLPLKARAALLKYSELCQMGSISPDYPYLNLATLKKDSEHWANAMHHKYGTNTEGNIFHFAIDYIKTLSGDEQEQCLAWFLGYASHVAADVTCHPVTNLLVGDYDADNETAHRVSEMHQDVHVFSTRLGEDVRRSDHIKKIVHSCGNSGDASCVKHAIERLWRQMLSRCFPRMNRFDIDISGWHKEVTFWIDEVGSELSIIPYKPLRKLLEEKGVSFPRKADPAYILNLETPHGRKGYDEIFDHAKDNVKRVWALIANGIFNDDRSYIDELKIWDLDIGQEVKTPHVFWKEPDAKV